MPPQDEHQELDALLTQILNRRVTIEQRMFDAAAGKRAMPTAEELRQWAIELGTPHPAQASTVPTEDELRRAWDDGYSCDFPTYRGIVLEALRKWSQASTSQDARITELEAALQDLFDAGMETCMMGDGKDDQIAAIARARAALTKEDVCK
jgi:hypothetical protein